MRRSMITLSTALCLLTFNNAQSAIISGYGALADVGTYDSCAVLCLRPGGLDFQVLNGGEFASFATAGINNSSGTSSASVQFTGNVFSPVLRAQSSSPSGTTASDAIATGVQAWTYTGTNAQTFSIDASLTGTISEPTSSAEGAIEGRIAAYLYDNASFGTNYSSFILEEVALTGTLLDNDQSFLTPSLDARTASITFTLNPGDEVYIWMQLETKSERGAIVDASGTFLMDFSGGDTALLQETISAVPVPPALWLFASGLTFIGLRLRRDKASKYQLDNHT